MAALTIDFGELFKDVPRGAWVAVSNDQLRVVAIGSDVGNVIEEARRIGENDPIIMRVLESGNMLVF